MKKALLVGINRYPDKQDWLSGCVNDVKLIYKTLKQEFDFRTFKVLTDKEATRGGIIKGLKWLLQGNSAGDTLLFHYSGHGSQVPVYDRTATEEADGLDEIICNYDIDWNEPVRDNDLGDILSDVKKGVNATVILDCCFSGTGLRNYRESYNCNLTEVREGFFLRNRYMPPPDSRMIEADIDVDDDLCFDTKAKRKPFIITDMNPGDAVLISACSDKQYAADADFQGRANGALTYFLVKCLKEDQFDCSYERLVTRVNKKMQENGFDQTPQLEGTMKRLSERFLK